MKTKQKKETTTEKYLKSIATSMQSIDKSMQLLVSREVLFDTIEEHKENDKASWATIYDDGKKKTSELLEECKSLFSVWSYYDNETLDKLCPPPKTPIITKYKESIEPDCLNMSYNDAIEKAIKFMSARERIILELQYFKETGNHLDIKGWTITSNLDSDGDAMGMCRGAYGRFCVDKRYHDLRNSVFGPREQIS